MAKIPQSQDGECLVQMLNDVFEDFSDILTPYESEDFRFATQCLTVLLRAIKERDIDFQKSSSAFESVLASMRQVPIPLGPTYALDARPFEELADKLERICKLNPQLRVLGRSYPSGKEPRIELFLFGVWIDGGKKAHPTVQVKCVLPVVIRAVKQHEIKSQSNTKLTKKKVRQE